jgi:hypothetical protein
MQLVSPSKWAALCAAGKGTGLRASLLALAGSQPRERQRTPVRHWIFCPARIFLHGPLESAARAATTPRKSRGSRPSRLFALGTCRHPSHSRFRSVPARRPDALCCPRRRRLRLFGHEAPDWIVTCPLFPSAVRGFYDGRPAAKNSSVVIYLLLPALRVRVFSFALVDAEAGQMPASAPYIPAELYPVLRPVRWEVMSLVEDADRCPGGDHAAPTG